jgi:hypothetical protein
LPRVSFRNEADPLDGFSGSAFTTITGRPGRGMIWQPLSNLQSMPGAPSRLVLLLCWVCATPGIAGEIISADINNEGERFTARSELIIHVPEPRVREILTRYENLPLINDGIKGVNILERKGADHARMRVSATSCILFICRDYSWVQDANILPSGDIETVMDPAISDFREGRVTYRLHPHDGDTRLIMEADIIPEFWFPPVVGPLLIMNKLRNEALETAEGVERVAAAEDSEGHLQEDDD